MARASPTQDWSQSNEYIKGRFETSALNSGSPPAANEASVYDAKRSVADDDELEIQQAPPEWLTNFNEYVTFIGLFSGCAYTAVWVSRKLYMTWTSQVSISSLARFVAMVSMLMCKRNKGTGSIHVSGVRSIGLHARLKPAYARPDILEWNCTNTSSLIK